MCALNLVLSRDSSKIFKSESPFDPVVHVLSVDREPNVSVGEGAGGSPFHIGRWGECEAGPSHLQFTVNRWIVIGFLSALFVSNDLE